MLPERMQQPARIHAHNDDEQRKGQQEVDRLQDVNDFLFWTAIQIIDVKDNTANSWQALVSFLFLFFLSIFVISGLSRPTVFSFFVLLVPHPLQQLAEPFKVFAGAANGTKAADIIGALAALGNIGL